MVEYSRGMRVTGIVKAARAGCTIGIPTNKDKGNMLVDLIAGATLTETFCDCWEEEITGQIRWLAPSYLKPPRDSALIPVAELSLRPPRSQPAN